MKYRALGHAGQIELFLLLAHGCLRVDFGGVVLGQGEHIFNKALHALPLDLNALDPLALAFDGALGGFGERIGVGCCSRRFYGNDFHCGNLYCVRKFG